MITHNRRERTLESLDSLSNLPERPPIVVVDNGSEDGTCLAMSQRFPAVTLIRSKNNLGAVARNLGVDRTRTPYVAFADDDVTWEPGCLSAAADAFDEHPQLGVLVAQVLVGRENIEDPICRVLAESPLPRPPGMPGPSLLGFLGGASVVRRETFLTAGGYPKWAFIGGEEELLAAEIVARGWWICYLPRLVAHHYPSPIRNTRLRDVYLRRNALWFKCLRRPLTVALRGVWELARDSLNDPVARQALLRSVVGLPAIAWRRRLLPADIERQLAILENSRRLLAAEVASA
jgi:GT2 family glycosyltransferase